MFTTDKLFPKSLGVTLMFVALTVPLPRGGAVRRADPQLQAARHQLLPLGVLSAVDPGRLDRGEHPVALHLSRNGLINQALIGLGFGADPVAADEQYSLWTIVLLNVWQFGSSMVIFLAALQNVPQSLYEAAAMDAGDRVFRITVPLITPVIFFNLIVPGRCMRLRNSTGLHTW